MIPFDFRLFGRVVYRSFFASRESDAPLTIRRAFSLVLGLSGFLILEVGNFVFLLLDELLYPRYRDVEIRRPVFIIGNPRSGTTFLHRVLSEDREKFVAFRTWEILFPSILQKKLLDLLGRADRFVGSPLRRMVQKSEKRVLGGFVDLHPTGLFHFEEDEMLLLHCFSSLYLAFFFPFYDELQRFGLFDEHVSVSRRERILKFYQRCLMRQVYLRGAEKTALSKNPMFSGKIESLRQQFPDCRFVFMLRNPLEAIPSMLSEGHASCVFADLDRPPSQEFQEYAYELAKICYRYPLSRGNGDSTASITVLHFESLVANPKATIVRLYQTLGLSMSYVFLARLDEEEQKARKYKSRHEYSIDQFSISEDRIRADLSEFIDGVASSDSERGAKPDEV